ncbi:MAG TPA: TrmH family RNA methyltransferase [Gemmatimonadaceae bacterium]|nr:TrmH family RNA methyltransferase [Gemmatimonadaceae bacterium]
MSLLRNIRVVLHEPQDPVNIGGTVRVMKNMGLDDLVLVRPFRYDPEKIERIAHNTRDLAGRVRHVDELHEAIGDCVAVYAFAGKHRSARWPVITPREMADVALERTADGPVAMLFGREDHGLPNEALDQSTAIVCIPTTEHMSLNLAQAILVGAYELHLAAGDSTRMPPQRRKEGPASTIENRELTIQRIHRALDLLDFFKTRNPEHVMRAVRSLVSRAEPATREMDLVKSMAIEVERTLERETRASYKAALNGEMYEPPSSDVPGIPPGASDVTVTADSDA